MKMKKLAVLIIGTMLFLNLHAGLITHLKFEDNLEDSYGESNGLNGPIYKDENDDWINRTVSFDPGVEGRAVYFDGNDYMEIGRKDFDPRGFSNSYAISIWVKSGMSNTDNNCYIGKHSSSGGNVFLFGYWSSTLRLQIMNTSATVSTTAEPFGSWTHYVITASESGANTLAKVFRNGVIIWSGSIGAIMEINGSSKKWVLGQDWDGSVPSDFFQGTIDNIRFYDNELDADSVNQIFLKESSMLHLALDNNFEDSIGNNNGSQTGGVQFEKGMENRSASLDGINDYIEFGTNATDPRGVNGNYKDYSISIWVKSDAVGTNCYIGKHDDSGGNVFLLGYWSSTLRLQIQTSYVTVSTTAEPTEWTHYVVTGREKIKFDLTYETDVQVYRNSSLIYSGTINKRMGSYPFTSGDYRKWVLGQDWDGSTPTDHFNGKIDNVRFYKRLLTVSEVQALYSSEFSGLRYCNTTQYAAGCTTTTETDNDLNDTWWWIPSGGIGGGYLVSTISIESIKVSEGWEAYLCTSTNSQGTCHYFDDGVYASGTGLPSELLNSTYSITVQPKTFDAAKKYFGYKKIDESDNLPVGFAYLYDYINFEKPTISNDHRRLFLDSLERNNFDNLDNTILGSNRASSANFYGNVYAKIYDNSLSYKYLLTSHHDFSDIWTLYPQIIFYDFNNNVKKIQLVGQSVTAGSVGVFISNDVPYTSKVDEMCMSGPDEVSNQTVKLRIECKGSNYFFPASEAAMENIDDVFYDRIYDGSTHQIERFADNYNLLMLDGHGAYNSSEKTVDIGLPDSSYSILFSPINNSYENRLGKLNTKWVETMACNSMGVSGVNMSDVGDAYYKVLVRLNGVGGYKNPSSWGCLDALGTDWGCDYYNYLDHWDDLVKNNKTVSKAWIDSWSESSVLSWWDRDARFLTLENCNCTQTTSCPSFMILDTFYNVLSGPMDQKTTTTGYDYYCFRDRESPNFSNYVRNVNNLIQEETYPEEFSSYSVEPVADSIIEELMGIKIGDKETRTKGENNYSYRDDYLIMKKSGKDFSAIMNRAQESFRYDNDWEYEAKDRFEEAKAIAETLTTLDLEYAGISKDTNEAFEVGGNGESLGKSVNSISFVFRPKINGVPVFIEDISVEYDAQGLYQIKSRVPHSITLSRTGKIMSEEKAVEELSKSVTIEEAEKGQVMYVLNENSNELVLARITKSESKKTFIIVPMEDRDE